MRNIHSFPFVRLAVIVFALATGALRAALPPEAQATMNKGVLAAQQQDYPLAIRFFQDARKLAPEAPEIFYNLGLAESKIPGRELRAMAWFGAYLAAYPTAPNAVAVKDQIEVLDVKNQSNTSRLIALVQEAASQISGEAATYRSGYFFTYGSMPPVAVLWVEFGDIEAAIKIADRLEEDNYYHTNTKEVTLLAICEAQAKIGDITGAQETARRINDKLNKERAQANIAKAIAIPHSAGDKLGIAVSDWLAALNQTIPYASCPLNTEPFLDLAGYLKSLPQQSSKPTWLCFTYHETTKKIIDSHNHISRMLRQQAKQQAGK